MRKLLRKELTVSASPLTYLFLSLSLLFLVPGYPVLCGAFFVCLGIFQTFRSAREANDVLFSALLPVAKKDIVKARYAFVCLIEAFSFLLMAACALLRMTVFTDAPVYRSNALMNANPFALGLALLIFGLFNLVFVGGFFKTAYQLTLPFVLFLLCAFPMIAAGEALHHFPGLEYLNAFGWEHLPLQLSLLYAGFAAFLLLTFTSCSRAQKRFEMLDL